MIKILLFDYTRLYKLEFVDMVKGALVIVQKHDPVALKFEGIATLVMEQQQPNLDALMVRFGKHPLTKNLHALREQRNLLLQAVIFQLDSVDKAGLLSTQPQRELASPFLHRMLDGIGRENEKQKRERLNQLFAGIDADAALKDAVTVLGFESNLSELRTVASAIVTNSTARVKSISERPKMRTRELKKDVSKAIVNLFNAIKLAELQYPELDYSSLINELNAWLTPYYALVKSRTTKSLNKNIQKETVAMSSQTNATAN